MTNEAKSLTETFFNEANALKVNPELKNYLDLLNDDERKGLEADLIASGGAREPIIVWKEEGVIVDGHNRYEICMAHSLPFQTTEMSFKDIEEVKQWMLRNQLNRRNLTPTRIAYFRGMLYNQMKQDPNAARVEQGGISTAKKLGQTFGVDEKTIRRDAHVATGIDAVGAAHRVEAIRDKLKLINNKNSETGGYTKEELEEIGKVEDPEVRVEAVKELDKIKVEEKQQKAVTADAVKKQKAAAKPVQQKAKTVEKTDPFKVAFIKPAFDSPSYNEATQVKPPLAENAVCYMSVADEEMQKAFALLKRWGFTYQGAYVFTLDKTYEGVFADVKHVFMLAATKGNMVMDGRASVSIVSPNGNPDDAMVKVIEGNHPKARRLDMRKERTAKGWEAL